MRDVEPTWSDERYGIRDVEACEDGKVIDRGKEDGATFGAIWGLLVVIEDCKLTKSVTTQEVSATIRQELLEAIN